MPYKDPQKAREAARRRGRAYRERHPERVIAATMKWRNSNRERIMEKEREYKRRLRVERPDELRDAKLRSVYGVSLAWLRATALAQGGRCAICRRAPIGKGCAGVLHIDHDHATGRVRELLCNRCNQAIARLREDPELCRSAALYLEKHKGDVCHAREA